MIWTVPYIIVGVFFSCAAQRLEWFENFHDNDSGPGSPLGPLGIGIFLMLWPIWSLFFTLYYFFYLLGHIVLWISRRK